jgi:hypothetical protein
MCKLHDVAHRGCISSKGTQQYYLVRSMHGSFIANNVHLAMHTAALARANICKAHAQQ